MFRFPENYHEAHRHCGRIQDPVLKMRKSEKIGQNMKFDISILRWYDVEVRGQLFDTMLAHYLMQPDMRHNMDLLVGNYLNYKPVSIETLIGKKGQSQLEHADCRY